MHRRHAALLTALSVWLGAHPALALAQTANPDREKAPDVAQVAALDAALRAVGKDVPETRARAELTGLLLAPTLERALGAAERSGVGDRVQPLRDELGAALREAVKPWAEEARSAEAAAGDSQWGPALRAATSDRRAEDLLAEWLGFAPVGRLPVDAAGLLPAGNGNGTPERPRLALQATTPPASGAMKLRLQESSLVAEAGGSGHGNGVLDAGEWVQVEVVLVNTSEEPVPAGEARVRALGGCTYADAGLEHRLAEAAPAGGRVRLPFWVYLGVCPDTAERLVELEIEEVDGADGEPLRLSLALLPHLHQPASIRDLRLGASRASAGAESAGEALVAMDASSVDPLEGVSGPSGPASATELAALVARSLSFVARPAPAEAGRGTVPGDRFDIRFDGARFSEEHGALLRGDDGKGPGGPDGAQTLVTHIRRRYLTLPLVGRATEALAAGEPIAERTAPRPEPAPAPPSAEPATDTPSPSEQPAEPSTEDLPPPWWRVDLSISTGSLETIEPEGDRPLWSGGRLPLKSMDLRVSYGRKLAGVFEVSYAPGADSTEDGDVTVSDLHAGAGAAYVWRPIRYVELQPRALVALVRRTVGLPGSGSDAVGIKAAPVVGLTLRILPVPNGGLIADVSGAFGGASPVVDDEAVLGGTFIRFGGGLSLVF